MKLLYLFSATFSLHTKVEVLNIHQRVCETPELAVVKLHYSTIKQIGRIPVYESGNLDAISRSIDHHEHLLPAHGIYLGPSANEFKEIYSEWYGFNSFSSQ